MLTEVSPDVFANNRLSSVLDTGKSIEELLQRLVSSRTINSNMLTIVSPEAKHAGTVGITSLIGHVYAAAHRTLHRISDPDALLQPRRGLQELLLYT